VITGVLLVSYYWVSRNTASAALAPKYSDILHWISSRSKKCKSEMHENCNLFLFLIEINNMYRNRHMLPIPRICIWRRCGRCGVSWHRLLLTQRYDSSRSPFNTVSVHCHKGNHDLKSIKTGNSNQLTRWSILPSLSIQFISTKHSSRESKTKQSTV